MHHSPTFSVEDESLRVGAGVMVRSALGIGRAVSRAGHNGPMTASDLFSIAGKTALVTGGTRGIGRMIAEGFVDAGATVYISSRKADACAEVAAELSQKGTCIGIPADLSTEAGCRRLADEMAAAGRPARHPGQQRRRHLGHAAGRLRRGRLRAGARPQREGRLPPDQVPGAAAARRPGRRRSRPGSSTSAPSTGSVSPRSRRTPTRRRKAAVHQLTRHLAKRLAPTDHRQRHRAGALRVQDDGGHARGVRGADRGQRPAQAHRPARRHGGRRHLPRRRGPGPT